jgi:hypothetical protein
LGRGGGENERERYTSTGPSLAVALASFVPPPGVVTSLLLLKLIRRGYRGRNRALGFSRWTCFIHIHIHMDHHYPVIITSRFCFRVFAALVSDEDVEFSDDASPLSLSLSFAFSLSFLRGGLDTCAIRGSGNEVTQDPWRRTVGKRKASKEVLPSFR